MLTYDVSSRQGETKFEFLTRSIKEDIRSGALAPSEKLPSKRALAAHLGVSVLTVENVYLQLAAEGYLTSRERSGYYVCGDALAPDPLPVPHAAERAPEDPARRDFSDYARVMRRVIAEKGACLTEKAPREGLYALREAIADHLWQYRRMRADPDRILIGSGAEYLYGVIVRLFGVRAIVGVEDPSYEIIRRVYESHGVRTELLPMDETGVSDEALEGTRAGILHVSPFHSYPTGIRATPAKRRAYLDWAKNRGAFLVEDDFDSESSPDRYPLETLFSMTDRDNVIYLNTFSRTLAPSARVGYMILPDALWRVYEEKLGFASCPVPLFDQEVLARYLAEGYYARRLGRLKRRRDQSREEK